MSFTYLIVNIFTFLSALFLLRRYAVRINWRGLALSYILVSLPFVIWDVLAVGDGHWSFNERYTLGVSVLNLAVEEVLFFICIPLACLALYEVVGRFSSADKVIPNVRTIFVAVAMSSLFLLSVSLYGTYTWAVSLVAFLFSVLLLVSNKSFLRTNHFWWYQSVLLLVFFITDTFLTALPVITYGTSSITGFRIGTIPIEDFLYNFVLNTAFVLVYELWSKPSNKV